MEGLPDLVRVLVNEAMQIERENYLGTKPYERSDARSGRCATQPKPCILPWDLGCSLCCS